MPLVSVMGGLNTPHLHSGVTHIICLLKTDDEFQYGDAMTEDMFVCKERGRRLMQYLDRDVSRQNKIKLVSPTWIRKKIELN